MNSSIQAFIFDVDGTLVDSVGLHAQAWQRAFAKFGYEIPFKAMRDEIGKGGDEILKTFLKPEKIDMIGEELKAFRSKLFESEYLSQVTPFPCVKELFASIKESRAKISVGSSAPRDDLQYYLNLVSATEYVDVPVCSDDVEKAKPHPDIFEVALTRLELSPEDVLVVGDSPHDAEAAKQIGIKSIGLLCGGFAKDSLLNAGMSAVYRDPAELLRDVDNILKPSQL